MLDTYIEKINATRSLTQAESYQATLLLLEKDTPPEKIITYLTTLHENGETTAEILGVIEALKKQMIKLSITHPALDIVGTGGDGANSINISTGAAVLAASCGVPIVKHGNRSVSSASGSADVLEALGINIEMDHEKSTVCFEQLNITFCFAPKFHPALAQLRDIRRQIATPTIFNLVGPFLNPAQPTHYLIGVASAKCLQPFANILSALSIKKSAIVHSDGLDELTCSAPTQVVEINKNQQNTYTLDPGNLGFNRCHKINLKGGTPTENAKTLLDILNGKTGSITDTIILNAAMAVYLYGKSANLQDAVELARKCLATGKAAELLNQWVLFCGK